MHRTCSTGTYVRVRLAWLSETRLLKRATKAHTGFEPVSRENPVPEPLRRKLEELTARTPQRPRRGRR